MHLPTTRLLRGNNVNIAMHGGSGKAASVAPAREPGRRAKMNTDQSSLQSRYFKDARRVPAELISKVIGGGSVRHNIRQFVVGKHSPSLECGWVSSSSILQELARSGSKSYDNCPARPFCGQAQFSSSSRIIYIHGMSIFRDLAGIAKGMSVTFREMFAP